MTVFKFALFCSLYTFGFETINAEIRAMANGGRPVNWVTLRRLKLCQAKLSLGFSTVTDRLRPELISSTLYGTLAQVVAIFLVIAAIQEGNLVRQLWGTSLFLVPAVIFTLVPSWSCQTVLDVSEETRAALLTLEPRDAAADRQVTAFLAAVQRDLETFGDLRCFRLQLSTILGTTSTVLTYIIIMVQFQISENGCGAEGKLKENVTDAGGAA